MLHVVQVTARRLKWDGGIDLARCRFDCFQHRDTGSRAGLSARHACAEVEPDYRRNEGGDCGEQLFGEILLCRVALLINDPVERGRARAHRNPVYLAVG